MLTDSKDHDCERRTNKCQIDKKQYNEILMTEMDMKDRLLRLLTHNDAYIRIKDYKLQQKMVKKQMASEEMPNAPGPTKLEMVVLR